MAKHEERGNSSSASAQDSVELNISGPDPAVWGNDEDRPKPVTSAAEDGMAIKEVRQEDLSQKSMEELKSMLPGVKAQNKSDLVEELEALGKGTIIGPGDQWERDEDGGYVNR